MEVVAAVGQEDEILVHPQALAAQDLEDPPLRPVVDGGHAAEIAVVPVLGHRLADDDLETLRFVGPVADMAAVEADTDRPLRDRRFCQISEQLAESAPSVPSAK